MTPPYSQKTRVIPTAAWVTAGCLFAIPFVVLNLVTVSHHIEPLLWFLLGLVAPICVAGYTLLVGYIYGDAKRRGMRYLMWTLLAIFLANGIGVILYFILREPMPEYCSACGSMMHRGYAYCPRCGAGMLPACGSCRRVSQPGWTNCAYCGTKL